MTLSLMWPLLALAAVAVVVYLVTRELRESTRGDVERRFVCPLAGNPVTATFVSDFFDAQHFQDVRRCSTFGSSYPPNCGKACLALTKDELAAQDARLEPRIVAMGHA